MRVLLLDDDERDRGLVISQLTEQGHWAVRCVNDLAAAQDIARDGGFDVVVVDLGLPNVSRAQVLQWVRQASKECGILIYSGDDNPKTRELCVSWGADVFLSKHHLDMLEDSIRDAAQAYLDRMAEKTTSTGRLKKQTVRLPDPELLKSATDVEKQLLETGVRIQTGMNEIVDTVNELGVSTRKGLRIVKDRLDKINGWVPKAKEEIAALKVDKKVRDDAAAALVEAEKKKAEALVVNAQKRRKQRARQSARLLGNLQWIGGTVAVLLTSPYLKDAFQWLYDNFKVLGLLAGGATLGIVIMVIGRAWYNSRRAALEDADVDDDGEEEDESFETK